MWPCCISSAIDCRLTDVTILPSLGKMSSPVGMMGILDEMRRDLAILGLKSLHLDNLLFRRGLLQQHLHIQIADQPVQIIRMQP